MEKLSNESAMGPEDMSGEIIKGLGVVGQECLTRILTRILTREVRGLSLTDFAH